jgi:hypothetical protein
MRIHWSAIMSNKQTFSEIIFCANNCQYVRETCCRFIMLLVGCVNKKVTLSRIHRLCCNFCPIEWSLIAWRDGKYLWISIQDIPPPSIKCVPMNSECNWLFQLECLPIERLIDLRASNEFLLSVPKKIVTLNRRTLCDT